MLIYSATIDSREYFLATSEDADLLKERVLQAVHAGGAFVDARSTSARSTSVLVTSATPVAFDIHEAVESGEHDELTKHSFTDFDAA